MNEVHIVDDDSSVRNALMMVLGDAGFDVMGFPDAQSFLAVVGVRTPNCVLLDVNLPGFSGIELLKTLDAAHYPAPIFVISGRGDIPTVVDAIRNGAIDFIEKPIDCLAIIPRLRQAIDSWRGSSADTGSVPSFPGRERLTTRERQVLTQIAQGASSKEASRELSISPRTVEVHRARIMEKLGAKNAADLMRIVFGKGGGHRAAAFGSRPRAS